MLSSFKLRSQLLIKLEKFCDQLNIKNSIHFLTLLINKKIIRLLIKTSLLIIILTIIILFLLPLPKEYVKEYSLIIKYSNGNVMRIYKTSDDSFRMYSSLNEIDPRLIKATLCYEDKYFYYHPGVNPIAIMRALYQNIRAGKIVSGGSTITMQLAKTINQNPRTLINKIKESLLAIQLEMHLSKKQILESYFNYIPYGGNLYGVAAASFSYFGKSPLHLYNDEIAYLIALPQSPTKRKPGTIYTAETLKKRDKILYKMLQCKIISEKEYKQAKNAPIPKKIRKMPFSAPHAADFIKLIRTNNDATHSVINSTIDENIQKLATSIANNYKYLLLQNDARQASIVVINNKTREVVALVGSLDYLDKENDGQVIGFWSYRSPGSTLKPFLYAKSIEKGLITTDMLIEDVPVNFNGFKPMNFYKDWEGLIPAEIALAQSLNVPFVNIFKKYGVKNFLNFLDDAKISYRKNIAYGLSLITGSIEVKLLELTNLYVSLARNGFHGNINIIKEDKLKEFPLIKGGAVILTKKALSIRERPDAPNLNEFINFLKKVYWKTGTSFGRKDAWSIGWINDYTVGVWVGNFDGKSSQNIVGANLAAPIMFDLLQSLSKNYRNKKNKIPTQNPDLVKIKVCSFSGYRSSQHCPYTKIIQVVKSAIPTEECPYHRKYIVEKDTGNLACPSKQYLYGQLEEKSFLILPSLVPYYTNINVDTIPTLAPDCQEIYSTNKLLILSPIDGATYIIYKNVYPKNSISLQAFTYLAKARINWFVNGQHIGQTKSGEITSYLPTRNGKLEFFAIDDIGNIAKANITIDE